MGKIASTPGAYGKHLDTNRARRAKQRRAAGKPTVGSPEYKEMMRTKHGPDGDCKCPYHVKARERAKA